MTTARAMAAVAMLGFGVAAVTSGCATQSKSAAKQPLVTCKQIVETYKLNNSVDETADALFVHQSVVAACVKAAGMTPAEYDR